MPLQTGSEYINHCRALGFSDLEITTAMQNVGWQEADIQAALAEAAKQSAAPMGGRKSKRWLWILLIVLGVLVLGAIGTVAWFIFVA